MQFILTTIHIDTNSYWPQFIWTTIHIDHFSKTNMDKTARISPWTVDIHMKAISHKTTRPLLFEDWNQMGWLLSLYALVSYGWVALHILELCQDRIFVLTNRWINNLNSIPSPPLLSLTLLTLVFHYPPLNLSSFLHPNAPFQHCPNLTSGTPCTHGLCRCAQ